jgi:hypothetical protein
MPEAPSYTLYQRLPGLVLGFHGCDEEIGEQLLRGGITHLEPSTNKHDWLGNGIYFWENDPLRAWEFAQEQKKKPLTSKGHVKTPFVLGAVIDLGLCLNLTDRTALEELSVAHAMLKSLYARSGEPLPANKGEHMGARFLDRAVIEMLHGIRVTLSEEAEGAGEPPIPSYDSVRSPFPEGGELFDGAGFRSRNHIQIAVRNPACIKGYFRPIPEI